MNPLDRAGLVPALREIVGDADCLARPDELLRLRMRRPHAARSRPSAVVLPRDTDEVARVVRACRRFGVPFVPRGAGTGLSGGAIALEGGVVIECSRIDRVLHVDVARPLRGRAARRRERGALEARAAAWALLRARSLEPARLHDRRQRRRELRADRTRSSTAPPPTTCSPSSSCSRRRGRAARLADRPTHGYDLLGAVVGSEGTLGIVTEVTVRLSPIPECVETLLAVFDDVVSACRAVGRVIRSGLVPAALEIVDQRTIEAVEASVYAAGLPRDAGAVLLVELDGLAEAVARQVERDPRGRASWKAPARRRGARRRRARALLARAQGRLRRDGTPRPGSLRARRRGAARPAARGARAHLRDRRPPRPAPLERLPRRRRQPPPEHLLRPPRSARARTRDRRGRGDPARSASRRAA